MGNQNVPNWSQYQLAIFTAILSILKAGRDLVILARAGTGKTTTVTEAIIRFTQANPKKRVLACAFNRDAADELKSRFAEAGFGWKNGRPPQAQASTLHSFGLLTCKKSFGWKNSSDHCDFSKGKRIARQIADEWRIDYEGDLRISGLSGKIRKLADRAKESLTDPSNVDALIMLIWKFDVCDDMEEAPIVAQLASKAMKMAAEDTTCVDGADMIWFPHIHNLWPYRFDLVVVDEAQDMNPAQLALARKAIKRGGRMVAVGDNRQAIYGWRGADSGFLDRLVEESGAQTLPLPVTYRCAQDIVTEAQQFVPDYKAFEGNPDGVVDSASESKMIAEAAAGDFILSRTNAPLMRLCLSFLKEGRPAVITGRDVMGNLMGLIDKSECESTAELLKWLDTYENERSAHYAKVEADESVVTAMRDKVATLRALAPERETVEQLKSMLYELFTDRPDEDLITLSTAHRAKGLERDRVWLLEDTFRPEFGGEEENVLYVAITRAKSELQYVRGVK